MSGNEVQASPEVLEQIRDTLAGGQTKLTDMANSHPPVINAGESFPVVVATLGLLLRGTAGVAGGMQETTRDVQATHDTYLGNDDAAAELFRHQPR